MRWLLPALAATAFIASSASADDVALKATLQGRYAAMKLAMSARDSTAISAILAPNFVSVDASGAIESGPDMIREVSKLPKDPNKISTTTIVSLTHSNGSAAVRQRYDMKNVKTAADGTKQNVELIAISDDNWIQSGGSWLLQRTVTKQMDYFVNGASVMHKTATTP